MGDLWDDAPASHERTAPWKPNSRSAKLDRQAVERRAAAPNKPPYKPELLGKVKELSDKQSKLDPAFYCRPEGVPRMGPPNQIVQTPGQVVFLYAGQNTFRVIPTDGRPHSKDVDLTFMGDSVGHWEGDTLVIDTIGLKKWTLDPTSQDVTRYHSDALHVIEHIKYTDPMTADYQITIDDPKIWTKPWSQTFQMKLHPTWKLLEQVCEENNRCEAGKCRD